MRREGNAALANQEQLARIPSFSARDIQRYNFRSGKFRTKHFFQITKMTPDPFQGQQKKKSKKSLLPAAFPPKPSEPMSSSGPV